MRRETAREPFMRAVGLNPHNQMARDQADEAINALIEVAKAEIRAEWAERDRDMDRFDAACAVLSGTLANGNPEMGPAGPEYEAGRSVRYADALLVELAKERTP